MHTHHFLSIEEQVLNDEFLENGFTIVKLENTTFLEKLKSLITQSSAEFLNRPELSESDLFIDHTHKYIEPSALNDLRVHLINKINEIEEFLPCLYRLGKPFIDTIVGNELCIQRRGNLSIQLPKDEGSLLPLHTDVWSGNSPYEVVFWVPLVDCFKTKSMYILPINESREVISNFKEYSHLNAEQLYQKLKSKFIQLNVPFGSAAIFSHSLLHGNRINKEDQTRWSLNLRFKSALSPFGTKELGETFLPINIRPATRIGFHYKKPFIECEK